MPTHNPPAADNPAHPPVTGPITLWVCVGCDRRPARADTKAAEGRRWFRHLHALLAGQSGVQVRPSPCLGGCECHPQPGRANGSCSAALMAPGRFQYVLNLFNPEADTPKLLRLLALYRQVPRGRLRLQSVPQHADLAAHVATRLPPQPQGRTPSTHGH